MELLIVNDYLNLHQTVIHLTQTSNYNTVFFKRSDEDTIIFYIIVIIIYYILYSILLLTIIAISFM